jgi:predicted Zn-dependent protease
MTCRFQGGKYIETQVMHPVITKRDFTWDLISDSPDIEGQKREVLALKRAFLKWALVIPVKFKYVEENGDISITFSSTDNYFKNSPNALAYAFVGTMSQAIDLVFNESYRWVLNREVGNNQYDAEIVAIHEIGHVLGLNHSQMSDLDVMWPVYNKISDLSANDITRMQAIWGVRSGFSQLISKLKGYFSKNL